MSQSAPDSNSDNVSDDKSSQAGTALRLTAMLGAAFLATCVCYFALSSIGTVYPTPPEIINLGAAPTPEEFAAANAAKLKADSGNAMIWLGTAGAIIGALLALTSGLLRRSGVRTLLSVAAGILFGGGMGYLAGKIAVQTHTTISQAIIGGTSTAETKFMMMHGVTWLMIGLGVGLACELGKRAITIKSAAIALLMGGVMGGIAGIGFPLIVAIAAPLLDSSLPVPAIGTGIVVFAGLGAVLISIGVDQATTSK